MDEGIRSAFHQSEITDITLACILVECYGADSRRAGTERNTQHLQISLQLSALSWSSVLHDVHIIEANLFAQHRDAEVSLVYLGTCTFRESHAHGALLLAGHQLPLSEAGENLIYVKTVPVDTGCRELSAAAGHLPFGGITPVDYGYSLILCHITRNNNLLLSCFQLVPHRWSRYPRRCSRG